MTTESDRLLARLIDGELSPAEYRALLASFEDEPAAWRRCALAFLEAQALTRDLTHLRRTFDLTEPSLPAPNSALRAPRSALRLLALAASFLLAFTLGIIAPRFFAPGPQDLPLAGNNSSPEAPVSGDVRHQALRPIGNVRLVTDGPNGESMPAGEVPVYDVGQDFERFWSQEQPALAPELVELLRQRGHSVEEQRHYVPIKLEDGRQIVVPLEGYQITPVRAPAY